MATFRRFITTPFGEGGHSRLVACERLSQLLDSVCLRRTKDLLALPDQQDRIHTVEFSDEEQGLYESTKKIIALVIGQDAAELGKKSSLRMFQARLQQCLLCNHGTFQHPFSWTSKRNVQNEREATLYSVGRYGETNCSSCRQSMPILGTNRTYRTYTGNCAHVLCLECLAEEGQEDSTGQGNIVSPCPLCCSPGVPASGFEADGRFARQDGEERQENYFRPQGHSAKMAALIFDVQEDLHSTKRQVGTNVTRISRSILTYAA